MAIIPLRAYNREIEGMIDNGQLDEAVAHCRHILATFPKHIATYRLLGKAHLEQQRISDATDIFQRVLSAVPDDFISNVGMSIIREDENNLDASIWHMELAYEAQPSNMAIQDELRRLYGRRDGTQPPKVRLTRGALARMYAKGGLLDQAVAELRAAISEDPNRYDLHLLLANMYFQSTLRVEAVETCVTLLKKLPLCLAANQILAVCLPETDQSGTGKNYRQIAISMDPYFTQATQDAVSSDQVPENAINIERLEWKSGIQMSETPAQPTWATSLGVSLDSKSEEVLPEWLKGTEAPVTPEATEKPQPSVSPFIWDAQDVEKITTEDNKAEGEMPDWMKDAGWQPATAETTQKPPEAFLESPIPETQSPEDLEKGDIPDWLRGIAPDGMLAEEPAPTQPVEKEVSIPWLEKQQPGPSDSIIQWLEDAKPETPAIVAKPEVPSEELPEDEIPDWLKDLDFAVPVTEQVEPPAVEAPVVPSKEASFPEEPVSVEAITLQEAIELPTDEQVGKAEIIEPIPEVVENIPSEEILETEELPAAFADELPDWIKELAGETPEAAVPSAPAEEPAIELPTIAEEEVTAEKPMIREEISPAESLIMAEETPLAEPLIMAEEASLAEPLIMAEELPAIETPIMQDVLKDILPADSGEQTQIEQPTIPEKEAPPEISEVPGESTALTWLAGLEIEESTTEEKPVVPVGEQQEIMPEWANFDVKPVSETAIPELETTEEASALPSEEIPDWIIGLGETPGVETAPAEPVSEISPEPEAQPAEELPAWLFESELPGEEKETTVEAQEPLKVEEELPDWIKEIAATTPTEEEFIPPELAVTKKLTPLPFEPASEWTMGEAPVIETGEEQLVELAPQEPGWIPELETPMQAEPAELMETEAEVEPALVIPEIPIVLVEVPPEIIVAPVDIIPEVPFTQIEVTPEMTAAPVDITAEIPSAPVDVTPELQVESIEVTPEALGKPIEVVPEVQAIPVEVTPEMAETPLVETAEAELFNIDDARYALNQGLPAQAAEIFSGLINRSDHLEEVIKEVQEALYRYPVDVNLWVVLGDAYFRADELQDALNAYCKAEDLVR